MSADRWVVERGEGPILATAIHAGHAVRREMDPLFALPEADRLREEDPFTDLWVQIAETTVVVDVSRFEVDLNRPRAGAVYREPADAWGLDLWRSPLPEPVIDASLAIYDRFYDELGEICDELERQHGTFVVLDLHSYNHRRGGQDAPVDDPAANPEVNVGTGSLDRATWGSVIDAFMTAVADAPFEGGHIDVRENVRFTGGHMSRWINQRHPRTGCALAIEVKKIYMDEWTGVSDTEAIGAVRDVLRAGTDAIRSQIPGA